MNRRCKPRNRPLTRTDAQPLRLPLAESLVPLLVGSEGTLAVVAEAELALVPRPKHRGLLVPQFDSLARRARRPRRVPGTRPVRRRADGPDAHRPRPRAARPEGHDGRGPRPARSAADGRVQLRRRRPTSSYRVHELAAPARPAVAGLIAAVPALDPAIRDPLWDLRSSRRAAALRHARRRASRSRSCEDCAVAPERLPEFAARFREIFHRHGTDGAFYGHA